MPVSMNCPTCRAQFNVPDNYAGKKVKCARCATIFVARQDVQAPPDTLSPRVFISFATEDEAFVA